MSKHTAEITADGTVALANINKPANADKYFATIMISGSTFGSGTVTIQASPDGGVTKITVPDSTGVDFSATAATIRNIELGCGSSNGDFITLYAVMTGSTNPDVTITVFDNF